LAPIMDAQSPWKDTVTAVLPDWRDPNERVFVELKPVWGRSVTALRLELQYHQS